MTAAHRNSGFTLIELMITMLIIAILAAIAIPSYNGHVVRTNRAAAKACMSEVAQFMERFYTTNLTYIGADPSTMRCMVEGQLNLRYTIDITTPAATQRTYTVRAVPINAQFDRDNTRCGTLTLDQAGTRGRSGAAP